jgi:hypothetical protein
MLLRWASSQGGKAGFADPGYRALPPRAPSQAETAEAEEADAEQRPDRWFGGGSKKSDSYRVDRRWDDPVDPKPTRRQPQADEAPNPSGPGAKPKSTPTFSNSSHGDITLYKVPTIAMIGARRHERDAFQGNFCAP